MSSVHSSQYTYSFVAFESFYMYDNIRLSTTVSCTGKPKKDDFSPNTATSPVN